MWFKNLYFFAFTKPFEWTQEKLEEQLAEQRFTPCGKTELSHFGWTSALGKHGSSLVHSAGNNFLLCARKEEKLLPGAVVKDALDEKIAQLEADQARSATKKEKEQFKEDIVFELLPRAFSRISDIHAYVSPAHNLIVVNTSSRSKAEDFLALLRKSLGTLPVTTPSPDRAPDEIMTEWLTEKNLASQFVLGEEAEFRALGDDGAIVRVKNQDLASDEIKIHLDNEKYLVKVAAEWDETLSCVITEDLAVKRVKFFDVIHEQNDDIDSDDIVAKIDADFALMAGELNRFIDDLMAQFELKAVDYLDDDK